MEAGKMKRSVIYLFFLSIVIVAGIYIVLNRGRVHEVSLDQLFTSPGMYHGKRIATEGFLFHGWEVTVLCDSLEYSGYAEGHLVPSNMVVWVEGEIPQDVYDGLDKQHMLGPEERFGLVRVTGRYEYGGRYGHNGGYGSQIVASKIELLDKPS